MIIIRKLKKKKQKQELEIIDLINNIKYYGILRQAGNKLTIYKCKEEKDGNIKPIQPSKVMNILKTSKKVCLNTDEESLKLEDFLNQNNIKYKYIELCQFCLIKGRYNNIDKSNRYRYYNHFICLDCAIEEVKNEVNINEEFIEKLLRRFKDVNKVIDLFTMKNPLDNPDLTKYDVLTGSEEDTIKNYKIDDLDIPNELKETIKNRGIKELLPVQTLAVKGGLLDGKDLIITSATSSGKTLIGELAGIKNLKEGRGGFYF